MNIRGLVPDERAHRDVFVLSGGAARGAVEVGMMQTLLEAGIVPDALVGTSVGALNAAYVGWRPDVRRVNELAERWLQLSCRDIFPGGAVRMLTHLAQGHPYICDPGALRHLIEQWLPTRRLEELPTPVRIVTTPLGSAAASYHSSGDLVSLLLASAAVPGVFPPVQLRDADGRIGPHVDGGVADLVPLSAARDLTPTRVFVLDATVPARVPRGRTPIEMVVASLGVATRARLLPDLGAEVEVHHLSAPDLGTRMRDFTRTTEHLALGRRSAGQLVERLVQRTNRAPQNPVVSGIPRSAA